MNRSSLLAIGLIPAAAFADPADWPEFRGPTAQGISAERDLPLAWSEKENVAWRTPVAGRGWSSPVVKDGRVWLTTATDGDRSLRALALDAASGAILRDLEIFHLGEAPKIHSKNTPASPTPILEAGRVYLHFGRLGTACLEAADGKVVWKKNDLQFEHRHGPGGSPVIAGDLLIFNCDGTDRQFVVALEKETGKERWRSERQGKMAYCTPLLIDVAGARQAVSPGGERVIAYEPATGKEIWSVRYPGGYSLVARPVFGAGLLFVSSGFDDAVLYAIRPDGRGDATETHVAWKLDRGAPRSSSPLLVGEELYVTSDQGVLTCVAARSGEARWRQRLSGAYTASPVLADGRIYLLNEEGLTTVVAPDPKGYRELARSQLDGRTLASMAVAGGALYLRTDRALYKLVDRQTTTNGR